jgi:hypothetical protein
MDFASWKDRKILAGVLKTIYRGIIPLTQVRD